MGSNILVTSVYAKCEVVLREQLWNNLRDISQNYKLPCYIAGDFNCIIDPSEKQGGNLHRMSESMPMIQFIMDCDLIDPGFSGSQFTCGWAPNKRIWKRLDRVQVNQDWMNNYDSTSVNRLIRTGSDHSPLLTKNTSQPATKHFRFLDFWTNEVGFKEVVKQAWDIEVHGSPMWKFHLKLKNTCKCLSHWSKTSIGNIFDNVKDLEKKVEELEHKIITNNNEYNRAELMRINALFIRAYKNEESIWKQKFGIKWFVEGEVNSKFLHSIVKGRRKRLTIKKIRLNDDNWIEGDDHIANEAVSLFQNQFTREYTDSNFSILNCIPKVINEMDNANFTANPTMEELKVVVFSLSPSSAPGPDGLSGKFYQSCWDIIKEDLLLIVSDFFAADPESLKMMMDKMETYEKILGQLVNKSKSGFYVNFKDDDPRINQIMQTTGFNHCKFPMQYLGCLIYIWRKKVVYFNNMVATIAKRLQGWKGKFLSYGGKSVLIKSVLQAIPLHILSAVHPPKTTFYQIEKIISNFFWGWSKARFGRTDVHLGLMKSTCHIASSSSK
ncbi:PREDICTED: uncharacterized protein LOC109217274 [Nicotiana attenuata]|uniref:uncharacterized protein LOC109217274 n=1 Tax=Nicotiana attenuata TaxID=49451 RepID=UPI0009056094|nr:PREDICTED: uncharacterized protein LOC109217274 [Nicotiana attenuata]